MLDLIVLHATVNFHYSQLEVTFGTKFIKIRDKKFCANSWRLLHRLYSPARATSYLLLRANISGRKRGARYFEEI